MVVESTFSPAYSVFSEKRESFRENFFAFRSLEKMQNFNFFFRNSALICINKKCKIFAKKNCENVAKNKRENFEGKNAKI